MDMINKYMLYDLRGLTTLSQNNMSIIDTKNYQKWQVHNVNAFIRAYDVLQGIYFQWMH